MYDVTPMNTEKLIHVGKLTRHILRQLLAVVVGILDVRPGESNAIVDRVWVGLAVLDRSVTLTLHDDTNSRIIG